MERQDGFYRVKNAFGTWVIGYYYSQTGIWSLPGVSGPIYSRHLQEINETRIEENPLPTSPKDTEQTKPLDK